MYKEELALYNLQWLICHKIQTNQPRAWSDDYSCEKLILTKCPRLCDYAIQTYIVRYLLLCKAAIVQT